MSTRRVLRVARQTRTVTGHHGPVSHEPPIWRSYAPDPNMPGYEGPATLISDADLIAHDVSVRVTPEVQLAWTAEGDDARVVRHSWTAEIDGRFPAPPCGECLLILPGGGESPAVLHDYGRDGADLWRGRLAGRGPAPRPPLD